MQNNSQINYSPSYIPLFILLFLTATSLLLVLFLHDYRWWFTVLIIVVAFQYYQIHQHSAQALCYENQQWFLWVDNYKEKVDKTFQIFMCSYFLVVIFTTQDKKRWPCYFSRYNCSESQYRFLCATLSH